MGVANDMLRFADLHCPFMIRHIIDVYVIASNIHYGSSLNNHYCTDKAVLRHELRKRKSSPIQLILRLAVKEMLGKQCVLNTNVVLTPLFVLQLQCWRRCESRCSGRPQRTVAGGICQIGRCVEGGVRLPAWKVL